MSVSTHGFMPQRSGTLQISARVVGLSLLTRVVSHAVNVSSAAIVNHFTTFQGVLVVQADFRHVPTTQALRLK